ncbi:glycosyltransferase family 2 protein, partial [Vibrio makurazakiensis]|uniref:glycosyltransferase family A protein n=1 Tax=Vibrio makurazakiensis TaxID=2910250 RepID=UPI003D0FEEED
MSNRLLMMTTCIVDDNNINDLLRMLNSYQGQNFSRYQIVLLQGSCDGFIEQVKGMKKVADVIFSDDVISLSSARNRMIKFAMNNGLLAESSIITFPDDDCWYPNDNLAELVDKFDIDPELELLVCRYSSKTKLVSDSVEQRLSTKDLIEHGSSVTLFVRKELIDIDDFFDEKLGIGSVNNGGEDLDFSLRAYAKSTKSLFIN